MSIFCRALLDSQDRTDSKACRVCEDLQVRRDDRVRRDRPAHPDPRDLPVRLADRAIRLVIRLVSSLPHCCSYLGFKYFLHVQLFDLQNFGKTDCVAGKTGMNLRKNTL